MIMGNAVEGNHDYDRNMDHLGWSGQFYIVIKLRIAGMGLMKEPFDLLEQFIKDT